MSEALLVGATGLVGGRVIDSAGDLGLTILSRRAIADVPPQHRAIVAPTADWPGIIAAERPRALISCLGTTIRQAGSQAAFRAVDVDLILAAAHAAKEAGARQMIAVSSVGASPRGGNFYLRTKGETEEGLHALGFDRLDIVRPGLLRGDRGRIKRFGETIALMVAPVTDAMLHGGLRRYRSIAAATVARAIVALAREGGTGVHIHENDAIRALAD